MSKYNAVRTQVDGVWFDSKAEAARYSELKLLEKAGKIADLKIHNKWPLVIGETVIGNYESDFDYFQIIEANGDAVLVVEDVKGVRTPLYRWKKKHFEAQYGIKITEITKGRKSRTLRRAKP